MKGRSSDLRPDLARALRTLNEQKPGAVVIDTDGDAWQLSLGYWYRAYGTIGPYSSWDLAFHAPITVVRRGGDR